MLNHLRSSGVTIGVAYFGQPSHFCLWGNLGNCSISTIVLLEYHSTIVFDNITHVEQIDHDPSLALWDAVQDL